MLTITLTDEECIILRDHITDDLEWYFDPENREFELETEKSEANVAILVLESIIAKLGE